MNKPTANAQTPEPKKPNPKPKKTRLREMLGRKRGATVAQIEKALAWQPHTIRAEISRLRKSGVEIVHDRETSPPVYRTVDGAAG